MRRVLMITWFKQDLQRRRKKHVPDQIWNGALSTVPHFLLVGGDFTSYVQLSAFWCVEEGKRFAFERYSPHLQVVFSEVNISFWVYVCFAGKSRYRVLMQEDTLVHLIRKFLSYILAYSQIQTYFRYVWKSFYLISWHILKSKRISCTFGRILSLGIFPCPNVHHVRLGESYLLAVFHFQTYIKYVWANLISWQISISKRSSCTFGHILSLGIFPSPNVPQVRLGLSYLLANSHFQTYIKYVWKKKCLSYLLVNFDYVEEESLNEKSNAVKRPTWILLPLAAASPATAVAFRCSL